MSRIADLRAKGIVPSAGEVAVIGMSENLGAAQFSLPTKSPSNQKEAKAQLHRILLNRLRAPTELITLMDQRVLDIVQEYPHFAKEEFFSPVFGPATPLYFLVGANNMSLDTVKSIYTVNPDAIRQCDGFETLFPLHYACRAGAETAVVEFLIANYPEALRIPCGTKALLPIHTAAKTRLTSLETMRVLLRDYPESITAKDSEGNAPLDIAFNESCHPQLVKFLLEQVDIGDVILKIGHTYASDTFRAPLSTLEQCLEAIAPTIERVHCTLLYRESWEHTKKVLSFLRDENNALRHVSLTFPGPKVFDFLYVWKSLEEMVTWNSTTLQALGLALSPGWCTLESQAICAPLWLTVVQNLKRLELDDFTFFRSGVELGNLLQLTATLPQSKLSELRLTKISLLRNDAADDDDQEEAQDWLLQDAWRTCLLEKVSLVNCWIPAHTWLSLLDQFSEMLRLEELEIRCDQCGPGERCEGLDITAPLVRILQQGRLKFLAVEGPGVQVESICEVLAQQPEDDHAIICPLQKYHVLESLSGKKQQSTFCKTLFPSNLTLVDVLLPRDGPTVGTKNRLKLEYFLTLNQFGRARLVENGTLETLVSLLSVVNSKDPPQMRDLEAYQIQYGILLSMPSLWSN